jgi:hypothetical protein
MTTTPTATAYTTPAEHHSDRVRWALACLVMVVNEGRRAGWLIGRRTVESDSAE